MDEFSTFLNQSCKNRFMRVSLTTDFIASWYYKNFDSSKLKNSNVAFIWMYLRQLFIYVTVFGEVPSIFNWSLFLRAIDVKRVKCGNVHMWTAFEQSLKTYYTCNDVYSISVWQLLVLLMYMYSIATMLFGTLYIFCCWFLLQHYSVRLLL